MKKGRGGGRGGRKKERKEGTCRYSRYLQREGGGRKGGRERERKKERKIKTKSATANKASTQTFMLIKAVLQIFIPCTQYALNNSNNLRNFLQDLPLH